MGRHDIVEQFLRNGEDVNVKDVWGNTALHFAAKHGHPELVETLLQAGA